MGKAAAFNLVVTGFRKKDASNNLVGNREKSRNPLWSPLILSNLNIGELAAFDLFKLIWAVACCLHSLKAGIYFFSWKYDSKGTVTHSASREF